jgi:uncharacterized damage-inducible protein DinB
LLSAEYKEVVLRVPTGTLSANIAQQEDLGMHDFPKNFFCTIRNSTARGGAWRIVLAVAALNLIMAHLASAQISPDLPNPIAAPNPLTTTLSIFRSNMQDKIMNAAEMMPESKYSYRPTKDVRSFGEILNHVADISYYLCSNLKNEAPPAPPDAKGSKAEIIAYLKSSFAYCDAANSGFTDAHLNDPANFWGHKTNKMFMLTQVGNHDALHYGNLVTYLRLNDLTPSGGWF